NSTAYGRVPKSWLTALAEEAEAAVLVERWVQDRAMVMQHFHHPSIQGLQTGEHVRAILYHASLEATQF
ncbi:hypothetical protein NQ301_25110, partial [Escherichia coli]|nr:hypothetical protein [Escherichia coli]